MSSLQKFHRRTNGGVKIAPAIGSGSDTKGYYLGIAGDGISYMYVAPKSTEVTGKTWGSYGTVRGTTSATDGLTNTNTLYAFGSAAHPAAYAAKSVTTGGYNTWYLPAKAELNTCWSNHSATPFSTNNSFDGRTYFTSTEDSNNNAWQQDFGSGGYQKSFYKWYTNMVRAVRRSMV
jgi:hypothetical protein